VDWPLSQIPHSVALARLDVFSKDAPGVLNGAHERVLIGIIHEISNSSR